MVQLTVLVVNACEPGPPSAQLIFAHGETKLRCGRTYSEAAGFLAQHPGTLIVCMGSSNSQIVVRLIREGHPSALIVVPIADEDFYRVEVRLIRNENVLWEILQHPEVMRQVQLAWAYCNALCAGSLLLDEQMVSLALM
jgi:hypothetical protein